MAELGTIEYLREEYLRFRKLMGEKKYMLNEQLMLRAIKGLFRAYLLTETSEEAAKLIRLAKNEYDLRAAHAAINHPEYKFAVEEEVWNLTGEK